MPLNGNGKELQEQIKRDIASHFILRLAYCRTVELRSWFIENETQLFRHRLHQLSEDERESFMQRNGLAYKQFDSNHIDSRKARLVDIGKVTYLNIDGTKFLK